MHNVFVYHVKCDVLNVHLFGLHFYTVPIYLHILYITYVISKAFYTKNKYFNAHDNRPMFYFSL